MKRYFSLFLFIVLVFNSLTVADTPLSADVGALYAQKSSSEQIGVPAITPEEFTRLSRSFSEPGGNFHSDNWVSNEFSYLEVLDPLKRHNIKGGAYIGVGPEQNFTYITAIKPNIAFIVDVRSQNRIQHLVYKILFEMANSPADFFSLLTSRPIKKEANLKPGSPINDVVDYFYNARPDISMAQNTQEKVFDILSDKYKYGLSDYEERLVKRVFFQFRTSGLGIKYTAYNLNWFPDWATTLTLDYNGEQLNPFNSMDDFNYLKKMHTENRIIPVTGNFGGTKAINTVGEYLRKHNLTVTTFYVSNVAEYIIRNRRLWNNWIANVRNLPRTEESVIMRFTYHLPTGGDHQTRLQLMSTFLDRFGQGGYFTFYDLILSEYLK